MVLTPTHVNAVYCITALSLAVNSILIFFICKHTVAEFGRYKRLMLVFAVFNIAYSIVQAVTMPAIHVYDMSFFIFASGLGAVPNAVNRFATAVFCSTFAQSLYLLALHFLYRYIQVVRPRARFLFESPSYVAILVALYVFVAADYGAVCFFNFGPSPIKDIYFGEQMQTSYNLSIVDVGYLGPIYVLNSQVQWLDVLGLVNVSVVIGSTLALIPFCGIAISRCLHKVEVTSKKTKELQVQMFRLLLIQVNMWSPLTNVRIWAFRLYLETGLNKGLQMALNLVKHSVDEFPAGLQSLSHFGGP
ncbi:7TM chemoreceptor [Ancylostoma caninum]|uniref:7TM chemoreceptor n=1 Tax=Ancylostoma caninum TaxID=29170 RepID=A0A368H2H7_ANCCA|nr:7TM chemoreceptor [Ancylostoma caninum]